MNNNMPRTDLALETREMLRGGGAEEIPGVEYRKDAISEINYHLLEITTDEGANRMGKPRGTYCTVEIEPVMRRDADSFPKATEAAAELLRRFLPADKPEFCGLVVGLGNRDITPDAVGPLAVEATLVTRHLKRFMPEDFAAFRDVSVITPGVLGTSGIESADYIKCICDCLKPDIVLVVDALAASSMDRLCRTLQITNTGITPGSGVGNSRNAVNSETLGVPVIAIGVPTVVDIRSIVPEYQIQGSPENPIDSNDMIVTPRSIDSQVACIGRLLGYSLNLALHKGLTIADIDMLLD